ncbi:hypothetical protein FS837_002866 [Tulasnella sp. UAMH 9824]|nr:hypothetical protein FS837_002866 [Tulasnella sp. UAMH 9824]
MHEPKGVDRYSQWAAVEAAVREVPELRPAGEVLREDGAARRKEVAVLDNRPDSGGTVEDWETSPKPSITQTLDTTRNVGKWTKFVTVIPGQHGRFRINAGMGPIYGGFSDVWQCDAKFSDGRIVTVAAKKFRAVRIARDAEPSAVTNKLLKRLTKELDIWMALQHPHITPLLGFVLEDDFYIISPWYPNGNVADYIVRHPEVDRIKLSRVPPVVHGDMKPDNVLIDGAGHAVIIDFGLSAIMEDDPTLATTLASNSLQDAGNARWMAPELLMEEGCIRSPSTDVYSFGCVALQIYTGEIPFKNTPTFRIIYALIQGEKPVVEREDYPPLCSPSVDWFYDLLMSCWDGNPTSRPSMVDVESTLRTRSTSEGER